MRDECSSPGTVCASIISCGSHDISRLHVWVDWMVLPFSNVMVIGLCVVRLLVAGAFSTKKWPVAPESEIAWATDLVMRCLLTIVAALGI